MSKRAWFVVRPWVWQSELVASYRIDLSVGSRQSRVTTLHNLRQNWRLHQLRVFLTGDRHEAQEMLRQHSEQQLLALADSVDFEELRALLLQSAPFRTVLLGAFVSPGWLSACQGTDHQLHHCPRCGQHKAGFAHMVYRCPALCEKPEAPDNPWQYRLGWPLKGQTKQSNHARLLCIVEASEALRMQRHPRQDA